MSRPVTQQRGGPAFGIKSNDGGGTQGLEVHADIGVAAGFKGDGRAAALARSLGVLNDAAQPLAQDALKKMGQADAQAGTTDAANDKIDNYKYQDKADRDGTQNNELEGGGNIFDKILAKGREFGNLRRKTYSEAVDRVQAVKAFQGAARELTDWANGEGALLPPGEFEAEFDKRMKADLGPMLDDPNMANEIGKRYLPLYDAVSGAHRKRALMAQQDEALDTSATDMVGRLSRGEAVSIEDEVANLAPILGDRTRAVGAVVLAHQQAAVEAASTGDPLTAAARAEAVLALLEGDIKGDDGKPMPGPGKAASRADSMQATRAEIAKITDGRMEGHLAVEKFRIDKEWTDITEAGGFVPLEQLEQAGLNGTHKPAELISWYNKGLKGYMEAGYKASMKDYLQVTGDRSWANMIGRTGPDGKVITEAMYEGALTELIASLPPEDQFAAALQWTERTGLVHRGTAARFQSALAGDGKDLQATHDEYEMIKAKGLQSKYLTPETAATYERVGAQLLTGKSTDVITAELKRDPKENQKFVDDFGKDAKAAMQSLDVHGVAAGDASLLNGGYVHGLMNTYLEMGLRNQLPPEQAAKFAKEQFEAGHVAIETPKGTVMMPKVSGLTEDSMQWAYDELMPSFAEAKGLDVEQLRFVPVGPNGEMILTDDSGLRVTPEVWTPQSIAEAHGAVVREEAIRKATNAQELERLRRSDPVAYREKVISNSAEAHAEKAAERDKWLKSKKGSLFGGGLFKQAERDNARAQALEQDVQHQQRVAAHRQEQRDWYAKNPGRANFAPQWLKDERAGKPAHVVVAPPAKVEAPALDTLAEKGSDLDGNRTITTPKGIKYTASAHDNMPSAALEKNPQALVEVVLHEATAVGLPPELVLGLAMKESSGGKYLRNPQTTARGPMQILVGTFQEMNRAHFNGELSWGDVRDQVKASVKYLQVQTQKFGSAEDAVLAYFLGPQGLSDHKQQYGEGYLDAPIIRFTKTGERIKNASPREYLDVVRRYAAI